MVSSPMEKNFFDQSIGSDIKRYKEIRKLTTGQGEDYTTGCLLEYEYIKNHYRLIAVYLRKQKNRCSSKSFNYYIKKNMTKIISRKCNSIITDSKLWRGKS